MSDDLKKAAEAEPKKTLWRSLVDGLAAHACHSCPEVGGLEAMQQGEKRAAVEPAASAVDRLASEKPNQIQR